MVSDVLSIRYLIFVLYEIANNRDVHVKLELVL